VGLFYVKMPYFFKILLFHRKLFNFLSGQTEAGEIFMPFLLLFTFILFALLTPLVEG